LTDSAGLVAGRLRRPVTRLCLLEKIRHRRLAGMK